MKTCITCIALFLFVSIQKACAQDPPQLTAQDSIIQSSWVVGIGYNIVDDSGDVFDQLFSVKSQWNAVPYPSRLSIGRYFKSGLGVETIATYNQYGEGNIIDGRVNETNTDYWGLDARLSYDLNKLIGETAWFDPYVGIGIGYTDANELPRGTYNAVIGFHTWFSDQWGLDFSSSGKWSFGTAASNHIQHAAGVVYRFGIQKGISDKGIEKRNLLEEYELESQKLADSIASATRAAEDAKSLADRMAGEKERNRLQSEEASRLAVEEQRKQHIQDAIESLGKVYFELNSSYLTPGSKAQLDELAILMEANPTLSLKIVSHADSRGTNQYNSWLSERRAHRTVGYLTTKGIAAQRLGSEGAGEEQLTNNCKNHVPCSEEDHRANRRSEFMITRY